MLHYSHRFHGYNALRRIYKNSDAVHGAYFTIRFTKNNRKQSRVAVVVSKKVLKSAVGRNRIRRRLYELFRTHLEQINNPSDIVCIVTSAEVRTMSHDALSQQFHDLVTQAGLYKNAHSSDTIKKI